MIIHVYCPSLRTAPSRAKNTQADKFTTLKADFPAGSRYTIVNTSIYLAKQGPLGHDKGLPFHEGALVIYNSPKPSPWLWL